MPIQRVTHLLSITIVIPTQRMRNRENNQAQLNVWRAVKKSRKQTKKIIIEKQKKNPKMTDSSTHILARDEKQKWLNWNTGAHIILIDHITDDIITDTHTQNMRNTHTRTPFLLTENGLSLRICMDRTHSLLQYAANHSLSIQNFKYYKLSIQILSECRKKRLLLTMGQLMSAFHILCTWKIDNKISSDNSNQKPTNRIRIRFAFSFQLTKC